MPVTVSVIVPVYMVEHYLIACIDSILKQSFEDYEIILVDDGTIDSCSCICDEYLLISSKIEVIHQKNRGLSGARNSALQIVEGKYIVFVDGDDEIYPDHLSAIVPYLENGNDMVAYMMEECAPDGTKIKTIGTRDKYSEYHLSTDEERAHFIVSKLLGYKTGWEACSRAFSLEFIRKHNLIFEDNNKIFAEDLCFSLCYCMHINSLVALPDVLYKVNVRESSIMHTYGKKLNIGRVNELAKAAESYLNQWEDCEKISEFFPAIFLLILEDTLFSYRTENNISVKKLRSIVIKDIIDRDYFRKNVIKALKMKAVLGEALSYEYVDYILNLYRYLIDGNYIRFRITNYLNYHFKKNG